MTEEFLPCPFCGDTPWFEGDGNDWKDDRRYVEMFLTCCSSMSSAIGWSRAREMTAEARTKEMKETLTRRWNKRYVEEKEEKYPKCGCRVIPDQLPFDWKEGMHTQRIFIPCEAHKNGSHSHSVM
jgi:hypothetical protein